LAEQSGRLQRTLGSAKWVAPENLHITLRFLGEVDGVTVSEIQQEAQKVAAGCAPFQLQLETLGAFPRPERARVLWAGPAAENEEFSKLARRLEEAAQTVGLPPERRKPSAHVTLARFRNPRDVSTEIAPLAGAPLELLVNQMVLMSSSLGPQGPTYSPYARFPLAG